MIKKFFIESFARLFLIVSVLRQALILSAFFNKKVN